MSKISELEPKNVFKFFEEISAIPRGSYKEDKISKYVVEFGKNHGYKTKADNLGNVVMEVPATSGYEDEDAVILQGHLDMVCEKEAGVSKDMDTEGLDLVVNGDFLEAEGTTLGGDDGIAVAYMLAIADDKEIKHPKLYLVFTVSEEVGMEGASNIDLSWVDSKLLLNIDSEDEGVFLTGCAGGLLTETTLPVNMVGTEVRIWYELTVSGLTGGHSGTEIDKQRANAIIVLGRVLKCLNDTFDIAIAEMSGGGRDNVIPTSARALIGMRRDDVTDVLECIMKYKELIRSEYSKTDKDMDIRLSGNMTEDKRLAVSGKDMESLIAVTYALPNGVVSMSQEVEGLCETSLNLGIMKLEDSKLILTHFIRSNVNSKKFEVKDRLEIIARLAGAKVTVKGQCPAWEYKEVSPLRDKLAALYEEMYDKKAKFEAVHAGVECGLIAEKIDGLDAVSMGPDLFDIHTPKERLSISSAKRVYEFILRFLEMK